MFICFYIHSMINSSMVVTILPMIRATSATRRREFLRKIKSESGLEFQEMKFSERRKSLTSECFEDIKSKLETKPKLVGREIKDSWEIPISNDNRRFMKNKESNFSVKLLSMTLADISLPSSSSSSSPFDDVYSISCLTDLREMQMKSDPNFFLKTSDRHGQYLDEQDKQDSTFNHVPSQLFTKYSQYDSRSDVSNSSWGSPDNNNTNTRGEDEEKIEKRSSEEIAENAQHPTAETKVKVIQSNGSLVNHQFCSWRRVNERKSIVPIDEPLMTDKGQSQQPNMVISLSSKMFEVDEVNKRSDEFPELVPSIKKESESNIKYGNMKHCVDVLEGSPTLKLEIPSPILEKPTIPNSRVTNNVTYTTRQPKIRRTVSTSTGIYTKNRLCLPCAESFVTKWHQIVVALTKSQRQIRKTKISGTTQKTGEDDKNSTFSFIFTTSLTGSKEPINFFDKSVLNDKNKFDGVDEICSTSLAQITPAFTGVFLYRHRCWRVTDYLCIGDRYCASNGQLLCQMSVAGLVILCCHDNGGSGETSGWAASSHEPSNSSRSKNSGSPIKSNRQSEHLSTTSSGRPTFSSGYTHPECDSDHAIPMISCVCGPKVKPSERHNRSALRLNLTGSSLIEIQACFPEMNRFIDGFRKIGKRVMIVSASYPEQSEIGQSQPTSSDERLNKDGLAFSNLSFDLSGEKTPTWDGGGNTQERQHPTFSNGTSILKTDPTEAEQWQRTSPLPGDTLTVLAVLQHLMLVDRMTFREARNVLLRAHYPLMISRAVISLLESIEHSMDIQRRRAARD